MHPITVLLINRISIQITETLDNFNLDRYNKNKLNYWFFKVFNNLLT